MENLKGKVEGFGGDSLVNERGGSCGKGEFCEKVDSLHSQFFEYGRNAKEWARRCMLLLPEIDKYKVWAKKGFGSLYEYAAKIAGLSRDQVNESLRILNKIEDKPALLEVAKKKGLWAIKPVVTIATKETEAFWAEKANDMTRHELEVYVKGAPIESGRTGTVGRPDGAGLSGGPTIPSVKMTVTVTMELSPETADRLRKLKGDGDYEIAVRKLFEYRDEALKKEKPESAKTESRYIPAEIKRFVLERDSGRCAFPGCGRRYTELHHTQGFARENVHDPDRIFCLCEAHHGLAHRGLIENEEMLVSQWKVRDEADRASLRFGIDKKVLEHRMIAVR